MELIAAESLGPKDRYIACPSGVCNEPLELSAEEFQITECNGSWSAANTIMCPCCNVEFTITNSKVMFVGVRYQSISEFNEKYEN